MDDPSIKYHQIPSRLAIRAPKLARPPPAARWELDESPVGEPKKPWTNRGEKKNATKIHQTSDDLPQILQFTEHLVQLPSELVKNFLFRGSPSENLPNPINKDCILSRWMLRQTQDATNHHHHHLLLLLHHRHHRRHRRDCHCHCHCHHHHHHHQMKFLFPQL